MGRNHHGCCSNCKRIFAKEKDTQSMCIPCTEAKKTLEKSLEIKGGGTFICKCCGIKFKDANTNKSIVSDKCMLCRIPNKIFAGKRKAHTKESIEKNNSNWVEGKNKKGKPMPLDILIAISEKKRLYDDAGWKHYLKGRLWDRI